MKEKKEFDFFDKPENIRKLWIMLYVMCCLLFVPDLFHLKHANFGFMGGLIKDSSFGFYAFLGFVSCAALILFSKFVGLILKVKENYYD